MHELAVPNHPKLHEALGRLAIAHTHQELILRYTVKTLSELSVKDGLDATSGRFTSEIRKQIRRLFKEKKPLASEETQLDAFLGAARRLSEKRNCFLHSAWSETKANALIKGEDHQWQAAPSAEEVDQVTSEILALAKSLNYARKHGFIHDVVKRYKEKREGGCR